MPSPLRYVPDEAKLWRDEEGNPIAVAEVTIRTIQGRFLMRPSPRSTSLLLGVIAKAQHQDRSHPIGTPTPLSEFTKRMESESVTLLRPG